MPFGDYREMRRQKIPIASKVKIAFLIFPTSLRFTIHVQYKIKTGICKDWIVFKLSSEIQKIEKNANLSNIYNFFLFYDSFFNPFCFRFLV